MAIQVAIKWAFEMLIHIFLVHIVLNGKFISSKI